MYATCHCRFSRKYDLLRRLPRRHDSRHAWRPQVDLIGLLRLSGRFELTTGITEDIMAYFQAV